MEDKKVQEELKESVHKIFLAGLGAMAMAEEEGSKFFKNLVEKGEGYETRGKKRWDGVKEQVEEARTKAKGRAESTFEKVEDTFDDAVARATRRLGIPSRDEIAMLTKRVEELTKVVEDLRPATKTSAKKSTAAASAPN